LRVVVYGSRPNGHARVVVETLLSGRADIDVVGLIDDFPENSEHRIGSLSVIGSAGDLARLRDDGIEGVVLGFGAALRRREVLDAITRAGLELPQLVHPLASSAATARVQPGAQVLPLASLGPGARVGSAVLVNTGALLEHDVTVEDCAVVGPGAVVAGRARIGPGAELGAGAVVLPDVQVAAGAVVGAGAVVIHNVGEGQTVVGVPARALRA
jgi:sugar O-acyltransferase (sialic acid O-acetyltransferase NeuD family)